VLARIQVSTHNAIFYMAAFLILFGVMAALKFGVRENRKLDIW
jgi:hypothetical protein